ncbi:MAG TPA: hypothetical protein VN037_04720 [Verrucomicrobiae bacterium]|jgi:hypothetical protein|nr:hypothetical protein [Verrucomicrobiae bacterium]
MIPLKDMYFKVQMCLSPEQETDMRLVMETQSRKNGGDPDSAPCRVGYSVEIMSIPQAFEWFQGLKHAYDQEQAASSGVTK